MRFQKLKKQILRILGYKIVEQNEGRENHLPQWPSFEITEKDREQIRTMKLIGLGVKLEDRNGYVAGTTNPFKLVVYGKNTEQVEFNAARAVLLKLQKMQEVYLRQANAN